MQQNDSKYYAFISYSHKDEKKGKWLHNKLETYRIPKKLRGQKNSLSEEIPKKIFPVFRDREELPVSSKLSDNITHALEESKFLIVICSPNSAKSKWVNEEIILFKKLHGEDRVLPIIIDGEPNVDLKPNWEGPEECFPKALKYKVDDTGIVTDERTEPICGDTRKGKDGKKNALLKLISGILSVSYNTLKDREQEKKIKGLALLISVLLILLIGFGWISWRAIIAERKASFEMEKANVAEKIAQDEKVKAEYEKDRAIVAEEKANIEKEKAITAEEVAIQEKTKAEFEKEKSAKTLAYNYFEKANKLVEEGKTLDAIPYLVSANKTFPKDDVFKLRLHHLISNRRFYISSITFQHKGISNPAFYNFIRTLAISPDGNYILTTPENNTALVWDVKSGKKVSDPMIHRGKIKIAIFSPDSKYLLTASNNKTLRIWESISGKEVSISDKFGGEINTANYSSDGKFIVAATDDGIIRVLDAFSAKSIVKPMKYDGVIYNATFSPDNKFIVISINTKYTHINSAQVWDFKKGIAISKHMTHGSHINSVVFSPDGKYIVTASDDNTARVWESQTGKAITESMQHGNSINMASFSPCGNYILTASDDGTAQVWGASTGKTVSEPMKHNGKINTARFSLDGKYIITSSNDNTAQVWDAFNSKVVSEPIEHGDWVYNAMFSPNGKYIITACDDKNARVWELLTGKAISESKGLGSSILIGNYSANGKYLITVSDNDTIQIYNTLTGEFISEPAILKDHILIANISPNGKYLITASKDSTVSVWDVKSGRVISKQIKHYDKVYNATFSPDSKYIITATLDNIVQVWDAKSGDALSGPIYHINSSEYATFSPNSKHIVVSPSYNTIQVYEVMNGKTVSDPLEHHNSITSIRFSPDGKYIVTASGTKTVLLWDIKSGKIISDQMTHENSVNTAFFSPDGTRVVSASNDNTARVWNVKSGKAVSEPMQHKRGVNMAIFSPDGKYIVTASDDNTARVWESQTGKAISELMVHESSVNKAFFSPDGKKILTTSKGRVRIWDFIIDEAIDGNTLINFSELLSQRYINDYSSMQFVNDTSCFLHNDNKLNALSMENTYIKWFLQEPTERKIFFKSNITFKNYKREKLDNYYKSSFLEIEQLYELSVNDMALLSAYCLDLISYNNESDFIRNYAIFNSKRTTEIAPDKWEVWFFRCLVLLRLKKTNEAEDALNKSIELYPNATSKLSQNDLLKFGELYTKQNNFKKALKFYQLYKINIEELHFNDIANTEVYNELGHAYYVIGSMHSNLQNLNKAVENYKISNEIWLALYEITKDEKYINKSKKIRKILEINN